MGVEEGDWKRLLEELAFLDDKGEGFVNITDISNIMQYYGITHEVCEAGRKGSFLA
jgi:beta-N-acetylglucosaminidase